MTGRDASSDLQPYAFFPCSPSPPPHFLRPLLLHHFRASPTSDGERSPSRRAARLFVFSPRLGRNDTGRALPLGANRLRGRGFTGPSFALQPAFRRVARRWRFWRRDSGASKELCQVRARNVHGKIACSPPAPHTCSLRVAWPFFTSLFTSIHATLGGSACYNVHKSIGTCTRGQCMQQSACHDRTHQVSSYSLQVGLLLGALMVPSVAFALCGPWYSEALDPHSCLLLPAPLVLNPSKSAPE